MEKNYFEYKNIETITNRKGLFSLFLFLIFSTTAFGQAQTFNSSGTFTVPAGVTSISVQAWGGGGSGGNNSNGTGRGGGGGGAYTSGTITVSPGQQLAITVGNGGNYGPANGSASSVLGIVANGGASGLNGNGATGGAGGVASVNPGGITDFVSYSGGRGGDGRNNSAGGGGGGGASASASGNGGDGVNSTGQNGGVGGVSGTGGGNGGRGANNNGNSDSQNGFAPGGGGGGRADDSGNNRNGGNGQVVITYIPAYQAQITSVSTGSTTWCAGETRTVSVTIKNVGTQPWSDGGGRDFNIGVKWNTNGTSWNDYNVRVDAQNLAPGATQTYSLVVRASNNLNETVSATPGYTTPLATGSNNLTFDVVYEGVAWFGWNTNGVGPGNMAYITPNITINALPATPTSTIGTATICSGNSTNITGNTSTGTIIDWYTALTGGTLVGSSNSGVNFSVSPTVTTTYYAEARNTTTGCVSNTRAAGVTVTVNRAPAGLNYTTSSASYCLGTAITTNNASLTTSGIPTATYSVSPALPTGLSLNTTTGAITGTPTVAVVATNYTVTATNTCGTTTSVLNITVNRAPAGLNYTTSSASYCLGTAITTNNASLTTSGIPTATYSVSPALPTGLSLNTTTGAITGTPTVAVVATNYTVTATNTCGTTTSVLNITVNRAPAGLNYTTSSASYCLGTAITTNSASLSTVGSPAATYSVSPALPTGLSLNTTTGDITGTPTVAVSATNYTVTATNTCGNTTRLLNITVNRAPAGLSYTTSSASYCLGTAITTNNTSLTTSGIPTATYSVSPALPTGLSLNTTTGAITGTPTVAVVATNYTVTATNTCGTTTSVLNITVNRAPAGLNYATSSASYCLGTAITTNSASLSTVGSPAATYSVSPALPTGLSLNTTTGDITGTPTVAVSATNYTVTATNTCGNTTRLLNITVNRAPAGLSYTTSSASYCLGTAITANNASLTTSGIPTATYSVSPALPTGLSLNTTTGDITGTPTVAVSATNYTVTATNTCGNTISVLNITVNPTPTLSGVSQAAVVCAGSGATINLTGLLPNSTSTINYTIAGAAQPAVTTVVANGSGAASFTTRVLTAADNYQYLQLSSVTTTSATPNCSANFYNGFSLQVRDAFTSGSINTTGQTICYNSVPTTQIGNATAASGGDANITYQWQYSTDNTFTTGVTTVANNSLTYVPNQTLTQTTYYRRQAKDNTCNTAFTTSTGVWTVIVTPVSVGGTLSGGTTPICTGSSIGTLTVSGYVGTIIRWDKSINGGGWNNIGNAGNNTYSETLNPYNSETHEYRAVIQNGSCPETYSTTRTIVVNQAPVGGGVYLNGQALICLNSSTGNMTLGGGYIGTIVRWEKRLNNAPTWTPISHTTDVYSENPSVSGTWEYRAVVGNGSCPVVYSSSFLMVVNPELTITLSNTNTSVCQTNTTTGLSYSATTGNPVHWEIDFNSAANAAGFSDQNNNLGNAPGTISINVPYSVSTGIYNGMLKVITYNPSCVSTSYPITVTVNALVSTPPTVGTITHPTCTVSTGSVVLSGLPASGTIVQTGDASANYTIIAADGGTKTITNLAGGNYNFAISNGGCSSNTVNVVITPPAVVKWTNAGWFPFNPTTQTAINNRVEFETTYSSTTNIEACSCYVNNTAEVTFNSGHTLKVVKELEVAGTAKLIFENNASLVQVEDAAVNSGKITYRRNTIITRYDYTYWSSPVVGRTMYDLSKFTLFDRYFSYDPIATVPGWQLSRSGAALMKAGHGYIIRGPQNYSITVPTNFVGEFIGDPNNGVINGNDLAVVAGKDYLLGNPYPSAIDADEFLKQNSVLLQGTLYFWTHNTPPTAATGTTTYKYTASDYASYNRTGGVGTVTTDGALKGGLPPNGKIAAGQGFFAPTKASGNILFNNSMRLSSANTVLDNSQFYKLSGSAKTVAAVNATEKSRVWLNLTNAEGVFKQTLVGYVAGATNDYDDGFDGISYNGNQYVDFYSVNQDKNLVIQGRALPFVKKDSVALGYNTTIKGDFKISIDQLDGIFTTQNVLLEDKELKVQHDLKKEAYTFSTEKGTFNNRFVLRYVDKNTVDKVVIPEVSGEDVDVAVMVSVKDGEIKINSALTKLDRVVVYDVSGRKLFQKNKIDANVLFIPHFVWNHQVLIVDMVLIDGTKVSKKIIN